MIENSNEDRIIGVIHALPEEIIKRFFQGKKTLFIKYLAHGYNKKSRFKLSKDMKFIFYKSKSNKSIVGDAIIKNIHHLNYFEIPKHFFSKLMLSNKELEEYSNNRKDKKALILELSNIRKFHKEYTIRSPVTMGGLYLTTSNINQLFTNPKIKNKIYNNKQIKLSKES